MQTVLGRWPIFWLIPQPMSGNGLDFPISMKYLDDDDDSEEKSIRSKHRYSSTASLNRTPSVQSQWSAVTHKSIQEEPIAALIPLKTKPSTNTIGNHSVNTMPNTPGSILTFSSNTTTLVDYQHPLPNYSPKSPSKPEDFEYPSY